MFPISLVFRLFVCGYIFCYSVKSYKFVKSFFLILIVDYLKVKFNIVCGSTYSLSSMYHILHYVGRLVNLCSMYQTAIWRLKSTKLTIHYKLSFGCWSSSSLGMSEDVRDHIVASLLCSTSRSVHHDSFTNLYRLISPPRFMLPFHWSIFSLSRSCEVYSPVCVEPGFRKIGPVFRRAGQSDYQDTTQIFACTQS